MVALVHHPEAFVVGRTRIEVDGLEDWMHYNELEDVAQDAATPLHSLMHDDSHDEARLIEFAGRHCYRSWAKGRSRQAYLANLRAMQHGSVFEHASLSFAISGVSRTLTHELIRHRVGVAVSQESQRYVSADRIRFVVPPLLSHTVELTDAAAPEADQRAVKEILATFSNECQRDLNAYQQWQKYYRFSLGHDQATDTKARTMISKRANEAARAHLPGCAETRLTWTANVRTLRHFFLLRGGPGADLEIRRLACFLLTICQAEVPYLFDDLHVADGEFGVGVVAQREA